jgi:tRNA G37 N-methylase TrmD
MLDLESKDCSFSYDGLKWFYEDEMGEDMRQFKVLLDGHKKRIEEYRDKKRAERLADRKTEPTISKMEQVEDEPQTERKE